MPRGPVCRLCADSALSKRAAALIAQGDLADIQIAEQLGLSGHAGRVLVGRHRRNCVGKTAEALAKAANKGRDIVEQRKELIAAAERGDPLDPLKVESIIGDIRRVDQRLERSAEAASEASQHTAIATLSGAQLRSAEVKLKASGVGGYSGTKIGIGIGIGGKPFEPFVLRLNVGEKSQTIIAAPMEAPPFEVQYADGRPFDTRDVTTNELVFVPKGHPTSAPTIDHEPIEQTAALATNDADHVDGDTDIDSILNSVFDKPLPDVAEEVEPAPTPRRGRPRRRKSA